jgi:homoserine dehydrogenase
MLGMVGLAMLQSIAESQEPVPTETISAPATAEEARSRAMLLHETIVGMLQVVHRDFFEVDESKAIPSASFEDVFHELSDQFQIKIRWLIVDTDVVNIDHQAQDDFERNAVTSLAKGSRQYAQVEGKTYRYAGTVRLASQCLKCHVKQRTSTEDRRAGLLVSMELQ